MWIVAVAWVYVVGLMALTETSIVAGIMTFFGYCVIPLSILFYLTGSKGRRARREQRERRDTEPEQHDVTGGRHGDKYGGDSSSDGGGDGGD